MATRIAPTDHREVRVATPAEGGELFDRRARMLLGISGQEFLARWDRGDYLDADDPKVNALEILIPFARRRPRQSRASLGPISWNRCGSLPVRASIEA